MNQGFQRIEGFGIGLRHSSPQVYSCQPPMGQFSSTSASTDNEDDGWCSPPAPVNNNSINTDKKARILCLHGWRTSAAIMSFQMGAFQANITKATYVFLDAPHPATGDPDPGIGMFYPDRPYYEWFYRSDDNEQGCEGLEVSMKRLNEYIAAEGPFDGLLGFSQGASMVTRLLKWQETDGLNRKFKFVILVGGVPPAEFCGNNGSASPIPCNLSSVPSLHIMGESDPFLPQSKKLEALFGGKRTTMVHAEGHNIPSMRTNLYPQIDKWIAANNT